MSVASSVAALVMEMTYGLNITSNGDRFLRAAMEAAQATIQAMVPGAFLVDAIPIRTSRQVSGNHSIAQLTIGASGACPRMVPRGRVQNFCQGSPREI